jgi:hypothetical protein
VHSISHVLPICVDAESIGVPARAHVQVGVTQ